MSDSATLRSVTQGSAEYDALLTSLARRGESDLDRVEPAVREILAAVRREGDVALTRYVERFEKRSPKAWLERDYGGEAALRGLPSARSPKRWSRRPRASVATTSGKRKPSAASSTQRPV